MHGTQGRLYAAHVPQEDGAAGVAVAGGTLWATAPAAARARRYGKARARSGTSSSRARRTARSTTTSATRRRYRRAGFGPPPGYTQPDAAGVGHAPFELTALTSARPAALVGRRARAVERRQDGRLLQERAGVSATATSRSATTRRGSCRTTTACSATRASARTTSARCSGRPGRTASTSCPARRAGSRRTASGATASSTRAVADHPRPARRGGGDVEDLLHRLRRRRGRRHATTSPCSGAATRTTRARRRPRGLPRGLPHAARCRRSRGSSRASRCIRRASAGRRLGRDGLPAADHRGAPASPHWGTRRSCSPTTSTAASSTTSRRRRSTPTGSASACRCGSISPHARRGVGVAQPADHVSTLKLIERLCGLPTLASRNHTFDARRRPAANYETGGAPAPPRDGLERAQRPVRPLPLRQPMTWRSGERRAPPLMRLAG